MLCKTNARAKIWVCILLVFTLLSCTTSEADEKRTYVRAIMHWLPHYDEIVSALGEIWIGYTTIDANIVTMWETEDFFIGEANFYYKDENGSLVLIGSVDRTGVRDKNGILLIEIFEIELFENLAHRVVGVSSSLVERDSLLIVLILQPDSGSYYWERLGFAELDIDIENTTISLFDVSRFYR